MKRPTEHKRFSRPSWYTSQVIRKQTKKVKSAFVQYTGTVEGRCGPASVLLGEMLMRKGIACEVFYNGAHMWVQVGQFFADPTAE